MKKSILLFLPILLSSSLAEAGTLSVRVFPIKGGPVYDGLGENSKRNGEGLITAVEVLYPKEDYVSQRWGIDPAFNTCRKSGGSWNCEDMPVALKITTEDSNRYAKIGVSAEAEAKELVEKLLHTDMKIEVDYNGFQDLHDGYQFHKIIESTEGQ